MADRFPTEGGVRLVVFEGVPLGSVTAVAPAWPVVFEPRPVLARLA